MRAIQITRLDGPEAVELVDAPVPDADGQILIEVKAAGVAFPELLQTRGLYQLKPELPFIPGSEVAGKVVSAPAGSRFTPGDRVAGITTYGGYAEYVTVDPLMTFKLPDNVSYQAGSAFMFNYGTSHFALVRRGQLAAGETVLVHGASGGIGTSAIQIAKAYGAGRVIAVTSTAAKGEIALSAGADDYVLVDNFREDVLARGGVDIVVDPVGGDRFTDSLRCLKPEGRLLVIGFTGGDIPTVKVNRLLLNNISVVGVGWGAFEQAVPGTLQNQYDDMLPHLEAGRLSPVLGEIFELEQASEALLFLENRQATGKVTLKF